MAQNDIYKYDMIFNFGGSRSSTSFYYRQQEEDESNGLAIATSLRSVLRSTLWDSYLSKLLSVECQLDADRCQLYAPTKDAPVIDETTGGFGESPGDVLANQSAIVVTKYPGYWSRNYIGRNYYPGGDEARIHANRMKTEYNNAWQADATSWELVSVNVTEPELLTFDQVVFSATKWKEYDPATGDPTDLYSLINTIVVQPVMGTQRSRRPWRGAGTAT